MWGKIKNYLAEKNCCTYWVKGWWNSACCKHDTDYYESGKSRLDSDYDLFLNVLLELALRVNFKRFYALQLIVAVMALIVSLPIALVMFIGVRIGGRSRYIRKQKGVI